MANNIIYVTEQILQYVLIYVGLYIIKKYVFLESELEKKKQFIYHCISIFLISISYIFIGENSIIVLLFTVALNISLSLQESRVIGFFLIFSIIGFVNGIMIPLLTTPIYLVEMSQKSGIIYSLVLYIVIFSLIFLFYFKSNKWRKRFEMEKEGRHLETWERILLISVGLIMMFYSTTFSTLPPKKLADEVVIRDIIINRTISAIIAFIMTITVIILIVQGNRKTYYHKKAVNMSKQMVMALANTIDAKDAYTNGHSTRVAKYSVMLAKRMGYKEEKLEQLEFAAMLHDIGKIGVPREIINKTSRLTDEEYNIIKTHPGIGSGILKEVSEIPDIAIGARYHHERYDGKGYPDNLKGIEIPEFARIIGVADAYDAMTSKRSYREVLSQEIVRGEIEKGMGTQFDPEIAKLMLEIISEDKDYVLHE